MSKQAEAFWRLLDQAEDYIRYREKTGHEIPASVAFREEVARPRSREEPGRAAQGAVKTRLGARPGTDTAGKRPSDGLAAAGADAPHAAAAPAGTLGDGSPRERRLAMLEERVHACTRCALHQERMNAVPGMGVLDPEVMVIGEGPGADEDRRGLPFVGRAGQFLDKWLEAIGLNRHNNVYITNIVKCRPPGNRDPRPHESEACLPYLREQIKLVQPRSVLCVGRVASNVLIGSDAGIGRLRGRTYSYNGIPLVPTYHPSGVLRNPELKRPVWEDLKRLRALLDESDE